MKGILCCLRYCSRDCRDTSSRGLMIRRLGVWRTCSMAASPEIPAFALSLMRKFSALSSAWCATRRCRIP